MNHKENYANLLSTLTNVETKGNNTIIIADCMRFLGQCIRELEQEEEKHRVEKMTAESKAEADEESTEETVEEGEEDVCHQQG